jgi:hypothetical protein
MAFQIMEGAEVPKREQRLTLPIPEFETHEVSRKRNVGSTTRHGRK